MFKFKNVTLPFDHKKIEGLHQDRHQSESSLVSFENEIGMALPQDCRDFLLDYGGGYLDQDDCYITFRYMPSDFVEPIFGLCEVFFYISENIVKLPDYNLFKNYDWYQDRMPKKLVPIAYAASNLICISATGDDRGKVYLWERDFEEEPGPGEECGDSNVYLVEESFCSFLESLEATTPEELVKPRKTVDGRFL